jgi:Pyridoxamine 5'-phosphate oxidase
MNWEQLEVNAPEIAELGRETLGEARVGLLGTLRKDGSPRISPIEPFFSHGHLLFGAMAWSLKVRDLRRDPRCVLHNAITGPDAGEGELKLYGRAEEADDALRAACAEGWWIGRPRESAFVFFLDIEEAAFLNWDYVRGEMIVRRWSPPHGFRKSKRSYP